MASIDASLKDDIKRLLRRINRQGMTIIHVTHDYREALNLASLVGVLHNGRIIQEGKPDEVFRKPVNKFVARYSGIRNFFRVSFSKVNNEWEAFCNETTVLNLKPGTYPDEGFLLIRSDGITILSERPPEGTVNCLKGKVTDIIPADQGMELTIDAGIILYADISADSFRQQGVYESKDIWVTLPPENLIVLQGPD